MTDPWAAAGAVQTAPPATSGQGASELASAYAAPEAGPSLLFGGDSVAPSLFNKTHGLGAERTGIIRKAPYNQQARDFNSKQPKYWSLSKVGGEQKNRATTTDAIDGPTGQPNRPVYDVMVELDTEYGPLSQAERIAVGRDPNGTDGDGTRVYAVSGAQALKEFKRAIGAAIAAGIPITKDADLEGLRLTVKRAGQTPNQGGNPSWVVAISITRP